MRKRFIIVPLLLFFTTATYAINIRPSEVLEANFGFLMTANAIDQRPQFILLIVGEGFAQFRWRLFEKSKDDKGALGKQIATGFMGETISTRPMAFSSGETPGIRLDARNLEIMLHLGGEGFKEITRLEIYRQGAVKPIVQDVTYRELDQWVIQSGETKLTSSEFVPRENDQVRTLEDVLDRNRGVLLTAPHSSGQYALKINAPESGAAEIIFYINGEKVAHTTIPSRQLSGRLYYSEADKEEVRFLYLSMHSTQREQPPRDLILKVDINTGEIEGFNFVVKSKYCRNVKSRSNSSYLTIDAKL